MERVSRAGWFDFKDSAPIQFIGYTLLCALASYISLRVSDLYNNEPGSIWISAGVALFILLTRGLRFWPVVTLGVIIGLLPIRPLPVVLIAACTTTVQTIIAQQLLLRYKLGGDDNLESPHNVLAFLTFGGVVGPFIGSALGYLLIVFIGQRATAAEMNVYVVSLFLGNALGILIFAPLLSLISKFKWQRLTPSRMAEALLLIGGSVLASYFTFHQSGPFLFLLVPLIIWGALRFEVLGAAVVTVVVMILGTYFTAIGLGPIASLTQDIPSMVVLQIFLGVLLITGLFVSTSAKVEARKLAFHHLARERKRFKIAAENSSDLIYEWNLNTGGLLWCGDTDRVLAFSRVGLPLTHSEWVSLLHPDDRQTVLTKINKAIAFKEFFFCEYRVLQKDGRIAIWEDSGRLLTDGDLAPPVFVGAVSDITKQREDEKALRKSQERYQLATTAANVGIWEWDAKTRTTNWSEVQSRLFGDTRTKISDDDLNHLIHPEDRERARVYFTNTLKNHQYEFNQEYRVIWPTDQSVHWILNKGNVSYDSEGNPVKAIGTSHDTTIEKTYEAEIKKAKDTAERASRAKMQFLANMSHEIRTPMNAILGFAELLLDETLDPQKKFEVRDRIRANGEQLLALINDILDLSKFEAGDVPVEKLHFSITDLVYHTLQTMRPLAARKGLSLSAETASPIPQVIVSDPIRTRQILTNLISNSIKFAEKGSIKLILSCETENQKPRLRFDVEDTGIGISPDAQKRIFQPFSQGDSSITRKFGGTGLGLSLSKRLANALGGDLKLKWSEVGKGSRFSVSIDPGETSKSVFIQDLRLPREESISHPPFEEGKRSQELPPKNQSENQQRASTTPRRSRTQPSGALKDLKILLAEDSPDNEELIRYYLTAEGAEVDVAHNGLEASKKATHSYHDLILMDIQMPVMDGLEATRQLRALGYQHPIVALTAHALKEEVKRSLDAGCDAHLTKPIQRQKLVNEILQLAGRERPHLPAHNLPQNLLH